MIDIFGADCIVIEFNITAMCDEWCDNNPRVERVDEYCARSVKTKVESFFDVLL